MRIPQRKRSGFLLLFAKGGNMRPRINTSKIRNVVIAILMLGFALVASARTGYSEQISISMHQARLHATQAAADLALLQTYSKAGVPWQVHFHRLQQVQDHVNALVADYNRLDALRYKATPSQVAALDRIQPLLQDLQSQVKETLHYLVYNSVAVNMPPFTQRVRAEHASVTQIFAALCNCARNNNVLVASLRDRSAVSDCSDRSFVTMP